MKIKYYLSTLSLMILALGSYPLQAAEKPPASSEPHLTVVELFTSQSCSSCPPADKLLEKLSLQDNMLVMSCHVSYWNHLQWQDKLSQEFCDIRQHGYASLEKPPKIYTPQMLVNGLNPVVGSREDKTQAALARAKSQIVLPIRIEMEEKSIRYMLPTTDFPVGGDFRLWMFGYKKSHVETIGSGENGGLEINYVNSALTYTNLGAWEGNAISSIAQKPEGEIDGVIIFGQAGGYGRIVAAGKLEF